MITALVSLLALMGPLPDRPAPHFEEPTARGQTVSLDDFAGKTVVLEWTNHGCPAVEKHYSSGHMQAMHRRAAAVDIVWIQVISSPEGTDGHVPGHHALSLNEDRSAEPAHTLLDADGSMAAAYGAETTPHMFVIDGAGVLRYNGAIDTIPSSNPDDIRRAGDYMRDALVQLRDGGEVVTKMTKPYGCAVPETDS